MTGYNQSQGEGDEIGYEEEKEEEQSNMEGE